MKKMHEYKNAFRILKGGKISLVVSALLTTTSLFSAPSGGVVTSGSATINQSGSVTNINQSSQKASINWNKFSIDKNETVNFNQPNVNSITLNRVVGNETSVINGALNANGQVWILNSNGVLFGKNASINTSGLLATTKNISDLDFQSGNYSFKGDSSASIINQGTINIENSGYVVFASNEVQNSGVIKAIKGDVHLVGASEYSINLNGNSLVNLTVDKGVLDALVKNSGTIIADGGEIYLTTNAVNELLKGVVNNTGVIEANSLDDVTGKVELFAHGGEVQVGGIINATDGFVETSGKDFRIFDGATISAEEWLIDPVNITIDSTLATAILTALGTTNVTIETDTPNYSDVDTSANESGSDGNIYVNSSIITTADLGAERTLTLQADNNIVFADGVSIDATQGSNANELNVVFEADSDSNGSGEVLISGSTGTTIKTNNGDLTVNTQIDSSVAGETPLVVDAGTGKVTLYDDVGLNSKLKSLTVTAGQLDLGTKLHYINTTAEQTYNTVINSLSTAQFANNDFESGDATGWSIVDGNIKLNGSSVIAGVNTPNDNSLPTIVPSTNSSSNNGAYDDYNSTGNYTHAFSNDTGDSSSYSLQLTYSSGHVDEGYGVVHGPYVVSDNTVSLAEGDGVSFTWKASGGSDAYDVFGYIINVDTGATQVILNETGANGSATTNWASASVTAASSGNYKFVFVAGSWDASGGKALGANLYIDNVTTYSNKTFSGSSVTFNNTVNAAASELKVAADKIALNAAINGTNTFTLKQNSAGKNIEIGGSVDNADVSTLDITNTELSKISGFSKVVFGDDNTGKVSTAGDISTTYDLTLIGKTNGVDIQNTLDVGSNTLTIESNGTVEDTGTGHVIAKNLNLLGSGTFTLDSDDNDVDVIAAGITSTPIGSLTFKDKDDVTISTINNSKGITSTGTVIVDTLSSNINVKNDIITTKPDSDVQLNAAGTVTKSSGVFIGYKAPSVPEPTTNNNKEEIQKIITPIANQTTVKVEKPELATAPKFEPNTKTNVQINNGQSVNVVAKAEAGEDTKLVTLSQLQNSAGENSVNVPLGENSLVMLINGGVNLPNGVDQEFYVVEEKRF
ncbi:hypothetical protein CRV08_10865 [Halarcobacter ebronensis]|uniref:Filamentous haemagglutinin FhaB/tRNA nuclease CdiA-like TPS domain-containing protein n=1 Tax=Halarcobacter ebronensis TaxID=1462615 RepID=A0A4Q0YEZ1_9BACT|nr:filamentous hemagglutinin N-terminal domain-containing protein [Halarcobacter ebronensis]RXJ67421.1 hypothetical protein CRV08_10865 [Halarcobacter ebronensis]